jgi:hypothetical protein
MLNNHITFPQICNRSKTFDIIADYKKELIQKIRSDRTYKMPKDYITWETLSIISAICLETSNLEYARVDISTFIHSHRFALWFCHNAPLYCLTPGLLEAFDRTDSLHKPGIFTGWQPSLPSFLIALPRHTIFTPDNAEIDYILIACGSADKPEWNGGHWRDIEIPSYTTEHHHHFQWTTVDSKETVWMSGTAINENKLVYEQHNNFGKSNLTSDDKVFIQRIRNLVVNFLLTLEYSPGLLSDVVNRETTEKHGFGKPAIVTKSNIRYPRWLGKNYQLSSTSTQNGTHASPQSHWRRGHWRVLESGEGRRWKESKRLWIEPILVNG